MIKKGEWTGRLKAISSIHIIPDREEAHPMAERKRRGRPHAGLLERKHAFAVGVGITEQAAGEVFALGALDDLFGGEQPERDRVLAAPVGVPVVRISRAPELLGQALNFLGIEAAREIGVDETPVEGERRLPGFLPFDERRVVERISSGRTSRARRIRRSRRPACGRPRR